MIETTWTTASTPWMFELLVRSLETGSDLPVWVYENQGEMEAHPCTELLISQRGMEIVESFGIVPMLALKDQDAINLPSLRSVAGTALNSGQHN